MTGCKGCRIFAPLVPFRHFNCAKAKNTLGQEQCVIESNSPDDSSVDSHQSVQFLNDRTNYTLFLTPCVKLEEEALELAFEVGG